MKSFLVSLVALFALAVAPIAEAQKSSQTTGDGGTTITLIQTGRATLVAGVVTIANTKIAATTNIFVQRQTIGGTKGVSYEVTRSAGTSFTITSLNASNATETADTSIIAYWIVQPRT